MINLELTLPCWNTLYCRLIYLPLLIWVKNRDSLSASPTSLAAASSASIEFQLNISLFVSQPLFKEQQRIFCIERCTRNCNSLQGEFSSFTSQLWTGRHPYPFSKKKTSPIILTYVIPQQIFCQFKCYATGYSCTQR